ncbi:MAG: TerC family protein [Verrucomicrobiae bacterium]|nr:TerC family protein [Verrucomicrobiae bacterium]
MFDAFLDPNQLATLALLIGLELVLGIDNILIISIVTSRLPEAERNKARFIGLALALILRIGMLFGAQWLVQADELKVYSIYSVKDVVLLVGGLFLLYKATKEIHHTVEMREEHGAAAVKAAFTAAIMQIIMLDMVFSVDSVITAVGLTDQMVIIVTAVIVSFIGVLAFAQPIGAFIQEHPAIKILALSFLLCIGVTLVIEGMHHHVPKAFIYLPMGFALAVELLQLRYDYNRKKAKSPGKPDSPH